MTTTFDQSQIIELNNLIKEHYGDEFNIFFMQGLFISHLSSATSNTIHEFMEGDGPILQGLCDLAIKSNLTYLLYDGLYNETARNCSKYNNIIPIVNLDNFRGKYFSYHELSLDEQRNLLDWYMGYFFGYDKFWEHEIIAYFLENSGICVGTVSVYETFAEAIQAQDMVAYELIKTVKPKYKDLRLQRIVKEIQQIVKDYTPEDIASTMHLAKSIACSLLSTVLVLAQSAQEYSNKVRRVVPAPDAIIVH